MLKVGIIGTGVIAGIHADAIQKNSDLTLVAVSDIDVKKGEAFAAERTCRFYRDYGQMLKQESLDVAAVCLPHHLHGEAGLAVLAAGCHLFMEKPMANSVAECDTLIQEASRKRLKLLVGHTHQYFPSLKTARRLLAEGAIGQLTMIVDTVFAYYGWERRRPWFLDPVQGGGGPLMNTGPHQVDHLLFLAGADPVGVNAAVKHNRTGIKVESDILAHVEFANGVVASLILCQGYAFKNDQVILRLIGTEGMMEVDPWGNVQLAQGSETREIACSGVPGHEAEWQDMAAAILRDAAPQCDGAYGRKVLVLIDAIYRSGRDGKPVRLP